MPNGDGEAYNPAWCRDRHKRIDHEFSEVWSKFQNQEKLLRGILLALVGNLGGVAATLVMLALNGST